MGTYIKEYKMPKNWNFLVAWSPDELEFCDVFMYYHVLKLLSSTMGASTNRTVKLVWFQVNHEDFNEGIIQVQAKKKSSLNYYA